MLLYYLVGGQKKLDEKEYLSIEELLMMIKEPYREKVFRIFRDNEKVFREAKGSRAKHQAWKGGYLDHLQETMNIAIILYHTLNARRPLPFSLSDALLVLFLHDLEKVWIGKGYRQLPEDERCKIVVGLLSKKYGLRLTSEQLNGLRYVEGEKEDFHPTKRVQKPLAAFAHICDIISGRIWYAFPAVRDDPWPGARRSHPIWYER